MSVISVHPHRADGNDYGSFVAVSTEESLECPFCFVHIETNPLRGVLWDGGDLQLFLRCKKCKNTFIGYAKQDGDRYRIRKLSKGSSQRPKEFAPEIMDVSATFVKIYEESRLAESENLMEICGGGYRKALEFLIKDYLISKNPEKSEEIKKTSLGSCIDDMINNSKIKEIAKRATWLGNDETHYFKKWEDKDLNDLKRLIDITIYFISMELGADKYIAEMPA